MPSNCKREKHREGQRSPVVLVELKKRADDWQLHLADRITGFAGSMTFVWVHVAIFAFWVASGLFGADRYPFQFLTFVVSLEAIFLSTFVMIGQNRQSTSSSQSGPRLPGGRERAEVQHGPDAPIHTMTQEIHTIAEAMQQAATQSAPTGDASPEIGP